MRVAVTGARGQLGAACVHEFSRGHEVVAFTHDTLDVRSDRAVAAAMRACRPDVIVNCAGYNDVDGAEDAPLDALETNALAVRSLARAAEAAGAALVHYGSDFVFDGFGSTPYLETDPPNPRSVYAASKVLGEWFGLDAPRGYVLRVESLFGRAPGWAADKGSVFGIVKTLKAGGVPRVFEDRTVTPTYVPDAAAATRHLVETRAPYGLYHCVNSGRCTWLEFAREAARLLGIDARFQPVKMADVTLRALRPQYCALSNAKLAAAGAPMPSWQDALGRYLQSLADPV